MVKTIPHRSKRLDVRPNPEKRKRTEKKRLEKCDVSELRIVSKKKSLRKERQVPIGDLISVEKVNKKKDKLDEGSETVLKRIKALNKKKRQVINLIEKQKLGVELNDEQISKIESMSSIDEELNVLLQHALE